MLFKNARCAPMTSPGRRAQRIRSRLAWEISLPGRCADWHGHECFEWLHENVGCCGVDWYDKLSEFSDLTYHSPDAAVVWMKNVPFTVRFARSEDAAMFRLTFDPGG